MPRLPHSGAMGDSGKGQDCTREEGVCASALLKTFCQRVPYACRDVKLESSYSFVYVLDPETLSLNRQMRKKCMA